MSKATTYEIVLILGFFMYMGAFILGMIFGMTDEYRESEDWFGIFNMALGIGCAIMFLMLPIIAYRLSKDRIPEFYAWLKVKRDEYEQSRVKKSPIEIKNERRVDLIFMLFIIFMLISMFVYGEYTGMEDSTVYDGVLAIHLVSIGAILTFETTLMLIAVEYATEPNPNRKRYVPEENRKKAIGCLILVALLSALINAICLGAFGSISLYLFEGMELESKNVAYLMIAMLIYALLWLDLLLIMMKSVLKRFSVPIENETKEINDPTLAFGQYLFDKEKE